MTDEDAPTAPDRRVGRNIRTRREELELTQKQVADALRARGWKIDTTALTRIENGSRSIRVAQLYLLADVLDMRPEAILSSDVGRLSGLRDEAHRALFASRQKAVEAIQALREITTMSLTSEDGALLLQESGLEGVDPMEYLANVRSRVEEWVSSIQGGRVAAPQILADELTAIAQVLLSDLVVPTTSADPKADFHEDNSTRQTWSFNDLA
nr:helix-turn-helix transcriptional regulator [Sphaerisporangium cinnabarinum]